MLLLLLLSVALFDGFILFPTIILSTLVDAVILFLVSSSLILSHTYGDVIVAGDVVVAGEAGEAGGLATTTAVSVESASKVEMLKEIYE